MRYYKSFIIKTDGDYVGVLYFSDDNIVALKRAVYQIDVFFSRAGVRNVCRLP
jgi:hypothetical protein